MNLLALSANGLVILVLGSIVAQEYEGRYDELIEEIKERINNYFVAPIGDRLREAEGLLVVYNLLTQRPTEFLRNLLQDARS